MVLKLTLPPSMKVCQPFRPLLKPQFCNSWLGLSLHTSGKPPCPATGDGRRSNVVNSKHNVMDRRVFKAIRKLLDEDYQGESIRQGRGKVKVAITRTFIGRVVSLFCLWYNCAKRVIASWHAGLERGLWNCNN